MAKKMKMVFDENGKIAFVIKPDKVRSVLLYSLFSL